MKYLIVIILFLYSCNNKQEKYFKSETITTDFYITDVNVYKYSKVKGYIIYNNIKVPIDNGNTGYYYKKYNRKPGDILKSHIILNYFSTNYGYEIVFGDVNISKFEK